VSLARREAFWAPALVVAAALVAEVLYVRHGWRMHAPLLDEFEPVRGAQILSANFWDGLRTDWFHRGPERLSQLLMWTSNLFVTTTPHEFRLGHVAFTAAWCLTALPVYRFSRGLLVEPRWAALVAVLAIVSPFGFYALSLLNVTIGYLFSTAFFFAVWRTAVRPGIRADVLVLVFGALMVLSRTGLAPLLGVAAVTIVVQAIRDADGPLVRRPWTALRRLCRDHPLLVVLGVAAAAVVLAKGVDQIVGAQYVAGVPRGESRSWSHIWSITALWAAVLTLGGGIVPMLIAAPWLVREALYPRARDSGALAIIALSAFALTVITTLSAPEEERYVAVLSALPLIAAAVALTRRQASTVGTVIAAVVLGRAVVTRGLFPTSAPYDFFVAPGRKFFANKVQGPLGDLLPVGANHAASAAIVIAVALAVVAARRWPLLPAVRRFGVPLVLACIVIYNVAGSQYAAGRFTQLAGSPGTSFERLTFIDRATGQTSIAMYFNDPTPGIGADRFFEQTLTTFFNRVSAIPFPLSTDVAADGKVIPELKDRWLVTFDAYAPLVFDARRVVSSTVFGPLPVIVQRTLHRPLRAAVRVDGVDPDGSVRAGSAARLAVYPFARSAGSCLRMVLSSPSGGAPTRYRVAGQRGVVAPGATGTLSLALDAPALTFHASGGGPQPDGRRISAVLGALQMVDC
jgi:hypothetical protein